MNACHRLCYLPLVIAIAAASTSMASPVLPLASQWTGAQSTGLTLEQAVSLAIERAPQLQADSAATESAQAQLVSAGRLPDPELVLGVDNLPATGEDAGSFGRDFMTMRKVGVMQTFPNGRKLASQRERAAAVVAVAQSRSLQTRQETAQAVAIAWIDLQAAGLVQQKLQQLQPEIELQAEAARTALANGRGSTLDALTARSAVSDLEDRLIEADREVRLRRAELARWIGEDAARPLAPMPALRELPVAREKLLASLHQHASLLAFDAQRALAQSEIDLARAEKRPDWSAELAYAKRGAAFSDMVSLEFRVGLPLFGGNRQDPMIRAKRAELSELEARREAELRMHKSEVVAVLAAWDAARERIALYERERLPLARERSQTALAGFRAGRVELTQVLASHVDEIEVQRSYAELVRQLGQAWVFLRYLQNEELP